MIRRLPESFFFLNDPRPPEFYPLPLHDPLPIYPMTHHASASRSLGRLRLGKRCSCGAFGRPSESGTGLPHSKTQATQSPFGEGEGGHWILNVGDRKSTRLNSSHLVISYAVFCLK